VADDASSASGMMMVANDSDDNSSIAAFNTDQPQTDKVPKELLKLGANNAGH